MSPEEVTNNEAHVVARYSNSLLDTFGRFWKLAQNSLGRWAWACTSSPSSHLFSKKASQPDDQYCAASIRRLCEAEHSEIIGQPGRFACD
jgi:hypothetical protein